MQDEIDDGREDEDVEDEDEEDDDEKLEEVEGLEELLEVLLQLSLQEEPALIPVQEINEQESLLSQL